MRVRRQTETWADYFSKKAFGGRNAAYWAAERWLDEVLVRIEGDARVRRAAPRGSRSATGALGVAEERYRVGNHVYTRFVARWPDVAKGSDRKRFSVLRYGRDEARARAIEAREAGVARYRAELASRQHEEAAERLQSAPPPPPLVKDPLSRKGISMARRRPRRGK